MSSKTLYFSDL